MLDRRTSTRVLATAGAVMLVIAVHQDAQVGLACVAALAVLWGAPAAVRWPLAWMAGLGAAEASQNPQEGLVAALAVALIAVSSWRRMRISWVIFGLVACGAVGLASRSVSAVMAAVAMAAVISSPIEELAEGRLVAVALVAAAVLPAQSVARAALALRDPGASDEALQDAEGRCAAARVPWCWSRATELRVQRFSRAGDLTRAQELVVQAPQPLSPELTLLRADLEVSQGHRAEARAALHRLAQRQPSAGEAGLTPEAAALWSRAKLREEGVVTGLPPGAVSFGGSLLLLGYAEPTGCVPRGSPIHLEWTWHVGTGFSPGEDMWVFVHGDGPGPMMSFDHQVGSRSADDLRTGETVVDPVDAVVPADQPAGRYALHLGIYDPSNGVRLHPSGEPGHVDYVEAGSLEVCP